MCQHTIPALQKKTNKRAYDVVIVGAGLAGLYTALHLDDSLSCAVITKEVLHSCNSSLAQGGIAAAVDLSDSPEKHLEDTLKAGGGVSNEALARLMVEKGPEEIAILERLGVVFDKDEGGRKYITREGGHRHKRVLHCGGDSTGSHLIDTLAARIESKPNVSVIEGHYLVDIITNSTENKVCGIVTHCSGKYTLMASNSVVIASGGIGGIYRNTTNQKGITADGIAAAIRAGAVCRDMEFVQFHPTAFFDTNTESASFLISEAVRGEGGILRNPDGEAFMEERHQMKDLAPRDVVAREIFREMKSHNSPFIYLDITSRSRSFLSKRFPFIFKSCLEKGIDISKDLITVAPVQHYFMGGIATDGSGRTNIDGLYACGEAACTGVHGANRLASNSLLECLVFSRQSALQINSAGKRALPDTGLIFTGHTPFKGDINSLERLIQENMQYHCGIIRNKTGLTGALESIKPVLAELKGCSLIPPKQTEVRNMAIVAVEILTAALKRDKNAGAHYREDL